MAPTQAQKEKFLKDDLYDALRWLLEGAVAWRASRSSSDHIRHQGVLSMHTTLVQARALYEFFYAPGSGDDARAVDFCSQSWSPPQSTLYAGYMSSAKPANKRVFHLVYDRETHSGGQGHEGTDHLKNQVLKIARDLCDITKDFVAAVDSTWTPFAQEALDQALREADKASAHFGIQNPIS